jgi:hypothetical protein
MDWFSWATAHGEVNKAKLAARVSPNEREDFIG